LLPPDALPEDRAAFRAAYGLDKPIVVQYGRWFERLLHGDLGKGIQHKVPVVVVANSNSNILMMESAQDWYGQDAGLLCGPHAEPAHPFAATSGSGPRCSIFDTQRAGGEDVARQSRRRDQDTPAGPSRLASLHTRFAMATAPRSVGPVSPSRRGAGGMHRHTRRRDRE
jgi:hypothetical protein